MSALVEQALGLGRMGLLAARAGFTSDDVAAIRRHAGREESRGETAKGAETYRVASILEPGEPANWEGLARCWERLGDDRAALARKVADSIRGRIS